MASRSMDESWKNVKRQIRLTWVSVDFDDDELRRARGSLPKMVNLISTKTGETQDEVRRKIAPMV